MSLLSERLIELARLTPAAPAVASADGRVLTWAGLSTAVDSLASRLPHNAPVALCLSPGAAFVVSLLAASRSASQVVLLNPRWTPFEQDHVLELVGGPLVLTDVERSRDCTWDLGTAGAVAVQPPRGGVTSSGTPGSQRDYVLFTSGTAGRPLGVPRTEEQIWRETLAYQTTLGITNEDRVATVTPLCHAYALVDGLLGALAAGAMLLPLPGTMVPRALLRCLARERITILVGAPVLFEAMARTDDPALEAFRQTARLLLSAGSPLTEVVRLRVAERFSLPLCNLYGSTETGTVAFQRRGANSGVGSPIPGLRIEIRDGCHLLPSGQIGQIQVRGEYVANRYLGGLCPEVFANGGVDTRDRGWIDPDGCVHVIGRHSDTINVAGNKVDPVEVEEQLLRLPGIDEAVVVPAPSPHGPRVAAVVRNSADIVLGEVQESLRVVLSSYKIPQVLRCVSDLPRGPTGKVCRAHVARQLFAERAAVVVVTHQLLGHTRRCLRSLLEVDYPELDIVVVDNGSTDGTSEYLLEFRDRATRRGVPVQLALLSENHGAAAARNLGVRLSSAALLVFTDNDTTFPNRDWLSRLAQAYRQDDSIGIIGPKLLFPFPPHLIQHAGGAVACNGRVGELGRGEPGDAPEFNVARDVQFLTTACWLMSRDVFLRAGGFSEDYEPYYFEEIDLCYRVKGLGYRVRYEPTACVHHYENASAGVLDVDLTRVIARNQAKFKRRWHSVFSREAGPTPEQLRFRTIAKPDLRDLPDVFTTAREPP